MEDDPEIHRTVPNPPKVGAAEGVEVTLFVETSSVPDQLLFRWQKMTTESVVDILPTAEIQIDTTDISSTLNISYMRQDYFGNYTLTATNDYGIASVTFVVTPYGEL